MYAIARSNVHDCLTAVVLEKYMQPAHERGHGHRSPVVGVVAGVSAGEFFAVKAIFPSRHHTKRISRPKQQFIGTLFGFLRNDSIRKFCVARHTGGTVDSHAARFPKEDFWPGMAF